MKETPKMMDATLEDLFAAFAAAGLLSAQFDGQPDIDRIVETARDVARRLAKKSQQRKRR